MRISSYRLWNEYDDDNINSAHSVPQTGEDIEAAGRVEESRLQIQFTFRIMQNRSQLQTLLGVHSLGPKIGHYDQVGLN